MTHPIMGADGELIACIQVISKQKKNAKSQMKLYAGFTNFDELFFGMYSAFIQAKVQ